MDLQRVFDYQGKPVRTVIVDGEPWFVAKDVCEILELRNHRDTLNRLSPFMKGVANTDTPGGQQEMLIVSEAGVYKLVFTSRKAEAERFSDWVATDVLPAIRKNGAYIAQAMTVEDMIIAQASSVKELKAQMTQIAGTVQQLQAAQEKKADLTADLPPAKEMSTRANINIIVRSFAGRNGVEIGDVYKVLYREFYYRYSIDLKARATHRKCSRLDAAEADGCLKDLLSLAIALFA